MALVPAPAERAWMDATPRRFANRCLPLLIANQAGWFILNSHRFFAVWTGGDHPSDTRVVYQHGQAPYPAISHFGHGILTFNIPYLFRTPPGYNLLARGPANLPKDGASALEGIIETDWTEAAFTMNWKITRPNFPVIFGEGEPICMVVPQRRGELEAFQPEVRNIHDDPDLFEGFLGWKSARNKFLAEVEIPHSEAAKQRWQRHYFRGAAVSGGRAPEHQTKLHLRTFTDTPST